MTVTLDAKLEQRIQREIDLGHYREPVEVIAHALDLVEAQHANSPADKHKALQDAFGLWAAKHEDGLAYQQRMRDEWNR